MSRTRAFGLFVLLFASIHSSVAQDLLSRALKLYLSSNYEEALTVFEAVEAEAATLGERQALREYRVLCLIAMDRMGDAVKVIVQMIDDDPFYRPPAPLRPPRLISLYDRVRRQRLPALGRERYAKGASAFDAHRDAEASRAFALVLRLVEEVESDVSDEQASELKTLKTFARRFLELSQARNQESQGAAQRGGKALESTDAGVVPPVPIRQEIPIWPSSSTASAPLDGELEITIDASGSVTEARLAAPIDPRYDPLILSAAKAWKYRPATKDGRPVPYRKVITVTLRPQRPLEAVPER